LTEATHRVQLTDSFLERLQSIEAFLAVADAEFAYDDLLARLRTKVMPNLARFPLMGRRYLERAPQSVEAIEQLSTLPVGAAGNIRVYVHDDYLIMYLMADKTVYLLSIRHHRQLSFDFSGLWQV